MPKYVKSRGAITNEGLYRIMLGATLTTIKDGKVYLDTSEETNMLGMFQSFYYITSLDLSSFDTSNVTRMHQAFENCSSLTSLDLSNFDTSKVTTMDWMFNGCSKLTSLKFPGMGKTKSVTSIAFPSSPLDHDSLMSIFDYNRVENSITKILSVSLLSTSKELLTDEEKAAITAKGYTIA